MGVVVGKGLILAYGEIEILSHGPLLESEIRWTWLGLIEDKWWGARISSGVRDSDTVAIDNSEFSRRDRRFAGGK